MPRFAIRPHRDNPVLTAAVVFLQVVLVWAASSRFLLSHAFHAARHSSALRLVLLTVVLIVASANMFGGLVWVAFRALRWLRFRTLSNFVALTVSGGSTYYVIVSVFVTWFMVMARLLAG